MSRLGIGVAGVLAFLAIAHPAGGSPSAASRSAACAAALNPGGTANAPDAQRSGPAAPLPSAWRRPRRQPAKVYLRSRTATFNRSYEFKLRHGHLLAHPRGSREPWRRVPLPSCLDGKLSTISADDDEMIGLDRDRQIYTMDNALKAPAMWNWTSRWGPPVWTGDGFQLPRTDDWSWSVISPAEDKRWTDPAGNHTAVGTYKVSHIWGLRDGGSKLSFWDPWLPRDNSYEMCGPHRSRFRAVNVSASGSHIFVIGPHGDMFTRLYDFDLSGYDQAFFQYTYDDQRGAGDGAPIQLPAEPWIRQPKIHGHITSAISVSKFGVDAVHARLRVAGRRQGRTGYWQRDVAKPRSAGWRFHATGGSLPGTLLPNPPQNTSRRGLDASENARYVMDEAGTHGVIANYNVYCSPAELTVQRAGGPVRRLTLHTVDGLRQTTRARGLDDVPRQQYGAIQYPSGRFETVTVLATRRQIVIPEHGWVFKRAG